MSNDTRGRIAAILAERDATVVEIAAALSRSPGWIADTLYAMADEVHCVAGGVKRGTYRRGPAPDGHTVDRSELKRRAIRAAVAHDAKTLVEICEALSISRGHAAALIADMGELIVMIDGDGMQRNGKVARRYIARDATPAPVVERVVLPGWAAALAA